MKRNEHTIFSTANLRSVAGADGLTMYTFNTAKHEFWRIFDVAPFYVPRSNPDGVAITIACIAPSLLTLVSSNPIPSITFQLSIDSSMGTQSSERGQYLRSRSSSISTWGLLEPRFFWFNHNFPQARLQACALALDVHQNHEVASTWSMKTKKIVALLLVGGENIPPAV
ncbi:Aste57867_576 [Aphanomyces stellatus]|uniref:Aste57867_576 protein n=1 Tax=Aphanomyces stellatus TaxID=120398 RepID=A0A485K3B1_9STRA|nr:hypothetical protein As57867_000575 [Aphanomyces stellatus]VFT77801.1 Aste57867_576 [Aphanomyces stellatus]